MSKVISVNISSQKGTAKKPVAKIILDKNGVVGDAHYNCKNRNISLLAIESIETFNKRTGMNIKPGEFAENITLEGVDLSQLKLGDQLKIANTILEVTQIGKECHGAGCAIFQKVGKCAMPTEGIFCSVVKSDTVQPADEVSILSQNSRYLVHAGPLHVQ